MTWPIAIFGCFTVFMISIVGFLLFVYLKEYNRDEKIMKEFVKLKDPQISTPLVYVLDKPKKKAPPPPPKLTDKNKKDIN